MQYNCAERSKLMFEKFLDALASFAFRFRAKDGGALSILEVRSSGGKREEEREPNIKRGQRILEFIEFKSSPLLDRCGAYRLT